MLGSDPLPVLVPVLVPVPVPVPERRRRKARLTVALVCVLALPACSAPDSTSAPPVSYPLAPPSTFSIVARDPSTGDLGVAVASKFFGVGAVVPWAQSGTGAIATQSYANSTFGPRGLDLLREGLAPEEAARKLLDADPERDFRQLGIVDAMGRSHSLTGKRCLAWAGARSGENFSAQGNLLVSEATVDAMAQAFAAARGELAERLVAALEAGEHAGGDARGRQSAALVVARHNGGYGGFNDRYVDLRVDNHRRPVAELRRLLDLQLGRDPVSRARKLAHQGHTAEAIDILRSELDRGPDGDALHFELARLLLAANQREEGKRVLQAAVARSPGYDHYHYQAARLLAEAGEADACLEEIRKTLDLNAEYAHVFRRELEGSSPFRPLGEKIERLLPR